MSQLDYLGKSFNFNNKINKLPPIDSVVNKSIDSSCDSSYIAALSSRASSRAQHLKSANSLILDNKAKKSVKENLEPLYDNQFDLRKTPQRLKSQSLNRLNSAVSFQEDRIVGENEEDILTQILEQQKFLFLSFPSVIFFFNFLN